MALTMVVYMAKAILVNSKLRRAISALFPKNNAETPNSMRKISGQGILEEKVSRFYNFHLDSKK